MKDLLPWLEAEILSYEEIAEKAQSDLDEPKYLYWKGKIAAFTAVITKIESLESKDERV